MNSIKHYTALVGEFDENTYLVCHVRLHNGRPIQLHFEHIDLIIGKTIYGDIDEKKIIDRHDNIADLLILMTMYQTDKPEQAKTTEPYREFVQDLYENIAMDIQEMQGIIGDIDEILENENDQS